MNQKYLMYGLGAAALLFVLKGKKQEPAPTPEVSAPPSRGKKKPAVKASVSAITDVQFGPDGEKVIARIMAIQRPAKGVAPAVQVPPGELVQLYATLEGMLQATLSTAQGVDMYVTLSNKQPRTRREETFFEALKEIVNT
jgi:hypothetical protein